DPSSVNTTRLTVTARVSFGIQTQGRRSGASDFRVRSDPLRMNQTTPITVGGQRETARAALEGGASLATSLYIHVPFCFHKCHYCDFYSFVDSRDRQDDFVDALETELGAISPAAATLESIF